MESHKIVNVSDINRKRSSLKNNIHSDEMKKLFDKKNLQFGLETIKENEEEVCYWYFNKCLKNTFSYKYSNLILTLIILITCFLLTLMLIILLYILFTKSLG